MLWQMSRWGGGRMEEGCIGSKRRVWYRAPNGQFASATQALSGQYSGEERGSNGEGSSSSAGGIRRIRRRRKSEEVERKYRCDFDGCDKAYGTLNRKYCVATCWLRRSHVALSTYCRLSCSFHLTLCASDLNTHRATNEHGPRLNAVGM